MTISALALLSCVLAATLVSGQDDDLLVTLKNGQVRGKAVPAMGGEVRMFLGMPYAKPPVGELRFKKPQPAENWEGVRDATRYSKSCYQASDNSFPGVVVAEQWNANTPLSEDCLYINVFVPRRSQRKPLQVMMYIFGGSFTKGTTSLVYYDARNLVYSQNIIVVTMNFRAGALGWAALPGSDEVKGNQALFDQRLAMHWVHENIAAFGGDASSLVMFGQSSGSVSLGLHVLSPGSNVLFKRAVLESAAPTAYWGSLQLEEMEKRSVKLGKLLGCKDTTTGPLMACLQAADPAEILKVQEQVFSGSLTYLPVVDGDFLPDTPINLAKNPNNRKVDVMVGLNRNEGTFILIYNLPGGALASRALSKAGFQYMLAGMFPTSKEVQKQVTRLYTGSYNPTNEIRNRDAMGEIIGDTMFVCPVLNFARMYRLSGGKVYMYRFLHRTSTNPFASWTGVMHGYEIEFVFGLPFTEPNPSMRYTDAERRMSLYMMTIWANFARTGNPSAYGVRWPMFSPEGREYLTIDTAPSRVERRLKANTCHFWDVEVPKILLSGR